MHPAAALRGLHHRPGAPLVLPNVWDAASARAVVAAGFPVVATGSAAVAPVLGYADGEGTPAAEMLAAVARMANAVDVPVTADMERGYGLAPAELADRLGAAGAHGLNLEDSTAGALVDTDEQAAYLSGVQVAAGGGLVLNARIDVGPAYGEDWRDEVVRRAAAYLAAGADCVYPIRAREPADVRYLTERIDGPVNILFRAGGPSIAELTELGVARISFGHGLHRAVSAYTGRLLAEIAAGRDPYDA